MVIAIWYYDIISANELLKMLKCQILWSHMHKTTRHFLKQCLATELRLVSTLAPLVSTSQEFRCLPQCRVLHNTPDWPEGSKLRSRRGLLFNLTWNCSVFISATCPQLNFRQASSGQMQVLTLSSHLRSSGFLFHVTLASLCLAFQFFKFFWMCYSATVALNRVISYMEGRILSPRFLISLNLRCLFDLSRVSLCRTESTRILHHLAWDSRYLPPCLTKTLILITRQIQYRLRLLYCR